MNVEYQIKVLWEEIIAIRKRLEEIEKKNAEKEYYGKTKPYEEIAKESGLREEG